MTSVGTVPNCHTATCVEIGLKKLEGFKNCIIPCSGDNISTIQDCHAIRVASGLPYRAIRVLSMQAGTICDCHAIRFASGLPYRAIRVLSMQTGTL